MDGGKEVNLIFQWKKNSEVKNYDYVLWVKHAPSFQVCFDEASSPVKKCSECFFQSNGSTNLILSVILLPLSPSRCPGHARDLSGEFCSAAQLAAPCSTSSARRGKAKPADGAVKSKHASLVLSTPCTVLTQSLLSHSPLLLPQRWAVPFIRTVLSHRSSMVQPWQHKWWGAGWELDGHDATRVWAGPSITMGSLLATLLCSGEPQGSPKGASGFAVSPEPPQSLPRDKMSLADGLDLKPTETRASFPLTPALQVFNNTKDTTLQWWLLGFLVSRLVWDSIALAAFLGKPSPQHDSGELQHPC